MREGREAIVIKRPAKAMCTLPIWGVASRESVRRNVELADSERGILKNINLLGHSKRLVEESACKTLRKNLPEAGDNGHAKGPVLERKREPKKRYLVCTIGRYRIDNAGMIGGGAEPGGRRSDDEFRVRKAKHVASRRATCSMLSKVAESRSKRSQDLDHWIGIRTIERAKSFHGGGRVRRKKAKCVNEVTGLLACAVAVMREMKGVGV